MSLIRPNSDALADARIVFLLIIKWDGIEYRFSSIPISVNKADGSVMSFDGGLTNDPIWTERSNLLGVDVEAESIPIEIVFDNFNMARRRMQGHILDFSNAELSFLLLRRGDLSGDFDSRILLFKGKITDPIVGDPNFPPGYASFSISQGQDISANPLLSDTSTITKDAFASARVSSLGKRAPFVFGFPGATLPQGSGAGFAEGAEFATPAYLASGSTILLIASHVCNSIRVSVEDENGAGASIATSTTNDALGNPYTYVDISATALNTDDGASTQYWVKWFKTNGGGAINPWGAAYPSPSAELRGAGDLIRYCLLRVNSEIDWQAWNSAAPFLNSYKFDGYLNENVDSLEWLSQNIMPFLPCEIRAGPKGLTPLIAMMYAATLQRPVLELNTSEDFYISSGIMPRSEADELGNWIIFKFGKIGKGNKEAAQLEIDPRASTSGFNEMKFSTVHAEISANRYGLRQKEIICPFVTELSTAARIASDQARIMGIPLMTIDIDSAIIFGYLMLGDLIRLTDEKMGLNSHLCQILGKQYTGSGFRFSLAIEENPVFSSRAIS